MGSRAQATIPSGSFRTLFVFPAQDGLQIDALLAMDGWLGSDAASFPTRFPFLFMVGFSIVASSQRKTNDFSLFQPPFGHAPRGAQNGAKMVPKASQMVPNRAKMGPQTAQGGPKAR